MKSHGGRVPEREAPGAGPLHPVLRRLSGGDRRSTGEADEVAREIARDPSLLGVVVDAMAAGDPVLRMRAADAVEKATRDRPELLAPFKHRLLGDLMAVDQQEVRWHLAQMLPRLPLDAGEFRRAAAYLEDCLRHPSRIVQVNALQALVDLASRAALAGETAEGEPAAFRFRVARILDHLLETGSPAVRARARMLKRRLGSRQRPPR